MTTAPRVRLRYTGNDEVSFAGSVHASPRFVTSGQVVEVDAWAAPIMLEGGLFGPADGAQAAAVEASTMKGKALDEALHAAGLPTTGTADEKRARLTEHLANPDENTEES